MITGRALLCVVTGLRASTRVDSLFGILRRQLMDWEEELEALTSGGNSSTL